ncbi:hypothetical protein [Microbacterium sp. NPDC055521]
MTTERTPFTPLAPVAIDGDVDDDFGPVDLDTAILGYLIRGERRDRIAEHLHITRAEVDKRIADNAEISEAESLVEQEWVVREKIRDLTRQASAPGTYSDDVARLTVLLKLAELEVTLIGWSRQSRGWTP